MTQQVAIEMKQEVTERITELPSATTIVERQLALHYLATMWDGKDDVFENGPLLGGATRALALGMLFNENLDPKTRLHTYDWFNADDPLDLPDGTFEALAEWDEALAPVITSDLASGSFLNIFRYLHGRQDYSHLVKPHVGYLPGHPDDQASDGAAAFSLEERDRPFAIAFVDGCKSWYGTKYWFREIVPHLRPGADVLFQDYGHFTCFWLPMLVGLFRERWELIAYVDYTYIWRLNDPPSAEEIDATYPDEPTDLSRADYERVLAPQLREAMERGDRREVLILQMQCAAAFAYLGLIDESREILDKLLMQSEWFPMRDYLKLARVSPAYTPEGRIEL